MWTKTTLRLSETNTPTQSSLWTLLTRLVYFAEESSFKREPRIPDPAGQYITGSPLNIPLCAVLPAAEAKGNIVPPSRIPSGRPGRLEPDWVVYGMRTKTEKPRTDAGEIANA